MGDDEARKRILARRARFVAVAMASAGLTAAAEGCGGNVEKRSPQPCLSPAYDAGHDASADAPEVCLEPLPPDASDAPQPCLGALPDDASDAPQPCLDVEEDAGAEPCLVPR